MQSAALAQVVLQALAEQVYGAHWMVPVPAHLPVPSQVPAEVAVEAAEHPAPQAFPLT